MLDSITRLTKWASAIRAESSIIPVHYFLEYDKPPLMNKYDSAGGSVSRLFGMIFDLGLEGYNPGSIYGIDAGNHIGIYVQMEKFTKKVRFGAEEVEALIELDKQVNRKRETYA